MSPLLFNVYIDNLNQSLSNCGIGCEVGGVVLNNLSYADDMCLLAPSVKGLRKLIRICENYAIEHDIVYNVLKTKCVCFNSVNRLCNIPPVLLRGHLIDFVPKFTYLGHVFTYDLKDDDDIACQRRALCGRANLLLRKFSKCSPAVKMRLFNSFCNNIYGVQLWCKYKAASIRSIHVCHNNALRRLLGLPRTASATNSFVSNSVNNFCVLRRKNVYSFTCRLQRSENELLKVLCNSDMYYSGLQLHWQNLLHR